MALYARRTQPCGVRADRKSVAEAFGKALRAERERAEISQEELADRSGVDRTFVSRAERGVCQPSLATVFMLSAALDVDTESLVALTAQRLRKRRT